MLERPRTGRCRARMLDGLKRRGDLSISTIRYVHAVLRIALGRAVKTGKLIRNVATHVEPPAKVRQELRPMSAEQVRAFLGSVQGGSPCPALRGRTGPGDATGGVARPAMVGRRPRSLEGHRAPHTPPGHENVGRAEDGRLEADASPGVWRERSASIALDSWRNGCPPAEAGAMEISSSRRRPANRSTRRRSREHSKPLSDGRVYLARDFHDLRHACATLHLEAGEELIVVSRILGHSTISTTADVYAHVTPAMLERTATRMDTILGRKVDTA